MMVCILFYAVAYLTKVTWV